MSRRSGAFALVAGLVAVLSLITTIDAAPPAPGKRGRLAPPQTVSRDRAASAVAQLNRGALGLPALAKTTSAVPDSLRLVALRIEFDDLAFGESPPADELHDRFYYQNHFSAIRDYFARASAGRFDLQVDVPDVVARAPGGAAAYGDLAAYDSLMVALTRSAIEASDGTVDFASYAGVLLVHAGPGQESDIAGDSPTQIWSGFLDESTFRDVLSGTDSVVTGLPTGDGVEVRSVVILPEWEVQDLQLSGGTRLGSLGVYAHEIGQSLGMLPLFDSTPSPVPDSQGIGNFDVMGYGLWVANGFIPSLPSTFNRLLMGWLQPVEIGLESSQAPPTTIVLRDQERGSADSVVARVWISPREYFLASYVLEDPDGPVVKDCAGTPTGPRRFFEFDDRNGNCLFDYTDTDTNGVLSAGDLIDSYAGAEWDFFMTDQPGGGDAAGSGAGLLILHVDEQVLHETLARGSTNVDSDARRKAVDVEEADGIEDLDRIPDNPRSFGSADDYWGEGIGFSPQSIPDTRSANGAATGWRIALEQFLAPGPGGLPGSRVRVRFDRTPTSSARGAPVREAGRDFAGVVGADITSLYRGAGSPIVFPGDDGRVFIATANLQPYATGGDSLVPLAIVPPSLRGAWIGAPACGRVDGGERPIALLAAHADSGGVARTRLFAWDDTGREVHDVDGNPLTNTGLFATLRGRGAPPALLGAVLGRPAIARQDGDSVRVAVFRWTPSGFVGRDVATAGRYAGGPIVADLGAAGPQIVWAVIDSAADRTALAFQRGWDGPVQIVTLDGPAARGPVRLAAAQLGGSASPELVVAAAGRGLDIYTPSFTAAERVDLAPRGHTAIAGESCSPIALVDVDAVGSRDLVFATDDLLRVVSDTGAELHGWPYRFRLQPELEREPSPGRGAGSPLVADLDGDTRSEILLHLPGGAGMVWNSDGTRAADLEMALPARSAGTPLLGWSSGALYLVGVGRFDGVVAYGAAAESLQSAPRSQLVAWRYRDGQLARWGELGGSGAHDFHAVAPHVVTASPNDSNLGSFVLGPNPAGEEARVRVTLTAAATVRCRLYNLEGEEVREVAQAGDAGSIVEIPIDLRGLAPGAYLARMDLSTGGHRVRTLVVRR